MSEDDEMDDLSTDATSESSNVGGKYLHKTGVPSQTDKFDYDVALLFSCHLEDEDMAEKVQNEMSQIELRDGHKLRVCLYDDPTFGGSIVERPRKVVRRCRFVLVMVTKHTQTDSHATFTMNESIGHILSAETPERRHCVRPLFVQNPRLCNYTIPDGLTDVEPVHWYDSNSIICQKKLAKLIYHDKGNSSEIFMKTLFPVQPATTATGPPDLDTDATAERPPNGRHSSSAHPAGSKPKIDVGGRGDFAQSQQGHSRCKGERNDHQPTADISFQELHNAKTTHKKKRKIKLFADSSGCQYRVTLQGTMQNVMVGHNQTMNVTNYRNTKSKPGKMNKMPVTTSKEVPKKESMELVSSHIGREWKKLGRELGLSDGELDTVRMNYHVEGQEEVVYQMLRKWNTAFFPTTLSKLAQACVSIGRGDIADSLASLESGKQQ